MSSRWADTEADVVAEAGRKQEKEAKKRAKAEKARLAEEAERNRQEVTTQSMNGTDHDGPPTKKRRLSNDAPAQAHEQSQPRPRPLLRQAAPEWAPCRNVANFETLNPIEEGSYGWVSRARETATKEIVALKKLKMDGSDVNGFPITGLREIQCLQAARHKHIVELREIVVGNRLDEVYLVMDFVEHDLRTLQEDMQEPFTPSEVKSLLQQTTSAVSFLHSHWILHRDLKTSNILLNNRGEIKIADFGMARYYGDPPPQMTQLVVTLWYRAPELLLGAEKYGQAIDLWSIGCIFGELLTKEPLLQGKNEVDQLSKIFGLCGIPSEEIWPGFRRLPNAKGLKLPAQRQNMGNVIRSKFPFLTTAGAALLSSLMCLNPGKRPSAVEVLEHQYFTEDPRPKSSAMFPTFPSKAGQEKRRRLRTPEAPKRGEASKIGADMDLSNIFSAREHEETGAGFQLRLV